MVPDHDGRRSGAGYAEKDTIGIFGQLQGCPNGQQELMGSRISINGNLIPTSQMCNQQTGL